MSPAGQSTWRVDAGQDTPLTNPLPISAKHITLGIRSRSVCWIFVLQCQPETINSNNRTLHKVSKSSPQAYTRRAQLWGVKWYTHTTVCMILGFSVHRTNANLSNGLHCVYFQMDVGFGPHNWLLKVQMRRVEILGDKGKLVLSLPHRCQGTCHHQRHYCTSSETPYIQALGTAHTERKRLASLRL